MKVSKDFSAGAVLAAAFLAVALLLSCVSPARADLTLSRLTWDFGSIEQGQTKTQKIVISNPGDQPLKIEKAELPESCSVTPSLDKTEIKPKQKLEVQFTFNSKGILGQIQEYAYIFPSGSDQKGIVVFTIKGEVFEKGRPRLRVTPQTWNFGTVTVGENRQRAFRCENVGTAELKIEKIQIYDTRFRVNKNISKQTLEPGDKADFIVSVTGKYPGSYDTDFYVKSNSAGRTFTKIGVKGYAVSKPSGLVVSPDFSSVTNNTPFDFEVTRTDKLGKAETLTVDRNSNKSFPREPGTPPKRPRPADYTLTIKLAKTPIPTPRPAKQKAPRPKPAVLSPKLEKKATQEKASKAATTPRKVTPTKPQKREQKEGKKPEESKGEKKPTPIPPSQKKEPEKPPVKAAPKPEKAKPSEAKSPRSEKPPENSGDKTALSPK